MSEIAGGQELQELSAVAFIGLDRQRRQAALAGKHGQPGLARRMEVRCGGDEKFLGWLWHWQPLSDWNKSVLNGFNGSVLTWRS
jgi:hypothetical protein